MEGNSIWKACINSKYGTEEGGGSLLHLEEAKVLGFGRLLLENLIS